MKQGINTDIFRYQAPLYPSRNPPDFNSERDSLGNLTTAWVPSRHRAKPNNVVAQTVLTLGGGRSCITATIFLALLNQSGRFRQTKGWDKIRLIPGVQRHVVLWISWFLLRRAPRKKPSYCPLAVFPGRISGSSPYRHFRGHQEHYCNFTDSPLIR